VSGDTVSTFTEIPAGDHLIPDSQVFVGGRGGASRWFSLLGVAIDTARNESAVGDAAGAVKIKFDSSVATALHSLEERNVVPEVKLTVAADPYDVKVLPSARLNVHEDEQADLVMRLTVRTKDASASEVTKNYYYAVSGARPLAGSESWTENNAKAFRESAQTGVERLVEAFAYDAAGRFAEAADKARKIKVTFLRTGRVIESLLLGETGQTIIAMPIFRDRPMKTVVQVFDKATVKSENR